MSVEIKIESKRYNCNLTIKEKVTFIKGESGVGKSLLTRYISEQTSAVKTYVSNNYDLVVLNNGMFQTFVKRASRKIGSTSKKDLEKYWSVEDNFPVLDSIIIIDDEDFVISEEFSAWFNSDKSNYYIIINRSHISNIGYSIEEVYKFKKNGKEHTILPLYSYSENEVEKVDYAVTEGTGSDYIYFSNTMKTTVVNPTYFGYSGGRFEITRMIQGNRDSFESKVVLFLVDLSAFGSNFESLLNVCKLYNVKAVFKREYLSFEYFLLKTKFLDCDIDSLIERDRLKYISIESLCEDVIHAITLNSPYSYSKSSNKFSKCYYMDCCYIGNSQCIKFREFRLKNKSKENVVGTVFEDFIGM